MAGDDGGGCFDADDGAKAIPGVRGNITELLAVGTQSGPDGRLETGRLGVPAGGQPTIGQHQGDYLRRVHQNIA
ncbi:hypothetical protein EV646_108195 [Kribbella antiqua]|uniref:Uncharacterized protein n=1 Tax=Kribbella antiqua TaxID=2512217 RepID=A0A4R2IM31_9ACTN|nr:hypothetical protein [Kribbella antiqua]TCO45572.1 hypothetical protein EV646_108195 [Kribbella antiqua]